MPIAAAPVVDTRPKLEPCTVTLDDPVAARFVCRPELRDANSAVPADVIDPKRWPTVNPNRNDALPSAAPLHRTDVSASHAVCSQPVHPRRNEVLLAPAPIFAPLIVTLADPVAALLACPVTLNDAKSFEKRELVLPPVWPTLSDTSLLEKIPSSAWHITLVSDPQAVRSQAVLPNRAAPLVPVSPMLAPSNVTLVDPVPPLFDRPRTLPDPTPAENGVETLPTLLPTVKTAVRLPAKTCPA